MALIMCCHNHLACYIFAMQSAKNWRLKLASNAEWLQFFLGMDVVAKLHHKPVESRQKFDAILFCWQAVLISSLVAIHPCF